MCREVTLSLSDLGHSAFFVRYLNRVLLAVIERDEWVGCPWDALASGEIISDASIEGGRWIVDMDRGIVITDEGTVRITEGDLEWAASAKSLAGKTRRARVAARQALDLIAAWHDDGCSWGWRLCDVTPICAGNRVVSFHLETLESCWGYYRPSMDFRKTDRFFEFVTSEAIDAARWLGRDVWKAASLWGPIFEGERLETRVIAALSR